MTYFTADASMVGKHHYTIRNCDDLNNLNEVDFSVHVTNTYAYVFSTPLQTVFFVVMGQILDYRFPPANLMAGQPPPVITVEAFEGYEDLFPKFMVVFDTNESIQFMPTSEDDYGQAFFFKFIVRASGVDSDVGFAYYCSVQVARYESEIVQLKMDPKVRLNLPVFNFFNLENVPAEKAVELWLSNEAVANNELGYVYYQVRFLVPVVMQKI
jgi:hypothetical protein